MGDKKLRSDIVNLRVVAILAVIFGHSTTIYWYNWTDYRTTQEAPVFAHVGNLAMLVLGLWMLISGFCVGFTLRGKKRFKDFFIKRFSRLVIPYWLVALIWMIPIRLLIEYPGYVNNVSEHIADSAVFVLPSYYREGVPRSTQEAMAIGRPVITTDVPGCRDTVIDGVNGFLIPKWDVNVLVEKMCFFIENPEQIKIMGKESYKIACEKFDVHKVNKKLFEIMEIED